MCLLPPVLTFSLHNLFQYVKLFLAGVNGTLVILCLIVSLGFEVLDLVLHICQSHLISLLSNDLGLLFLFVIIVWNGCILVTNRCILASFSLLDALLFHFYLLAICLLVFRCA